MNVIIILLESVACLALAVTIGVVVGEFIVRLARSKGMWPDYNDDDL